jgi:RNA polymerase subunit RPABC4/transcription elongation factor Spt4
MFFIAFFGIQDKDKHIGTQNNIICPSCGRLSRYEIHKLYRYFHIFLIPTFRWNFRYLIKTSCCDGFYELDPLVGEAYEKNPDTEIRKGNLRRLNNFLPCRHCANCKSEVPAEFSYCPYCGGKL